MREDWTDEEVIEEILKYFSDIPTPAHAITKLRALAQGEDEAIVTYNQKYRTLVERVEKKTVEKIDSYIEFAAWMDRLVEARRNRQENKPRPYRQFRKPLLQNRGEAGEMPQENLRNKIKPAEELNTKEIMSHMRCELVDIEEAVDMCHVKFFRCSNIKKSNSFYRIYSLLSFPVLNKQNKHTAAQILWQSA